MNPRKITKDRRAEVESNFQKALESSPFGTFHQWLLAAGFKDKEGDFYRYCHGDRFPGIDTAILIAKAAGTTVEAIWGHVEPAKPTGEAKASNIWVDAGLRVYKARVHQETVLQAIEKIKLPGEPETTD